MRPEPERRWILTGPEVMEEAVIGYRAWRVHASHGEVTLTSVVALSHHLWPKGRPMNATCNRPFLEHRHAGKEPAAGCSCGLWAFSDFRRLRLSFSEDAFLLGEVEMWRRVRVHKYGYRAQLARPSAIFEPGGFGSLTWRQSQRRLADLVCQQYDIPLVQRPRPSLERV